MQRTRPHGVRRHTTPLRRIGGFVAIVVAVTLTAAPVFAAGGDWSAGFNSGDPLVQLQASPVDTPTVASAKSLTYVAVDSYPGTPGTTIQRLSPDGSPDTAWSGDGVLTLAKIPQLVSLHPNPDGTVLVGGLDSTGDALVGRLKANGAWDKTFSVDGRVVLPVDSNQGVRALAVDSRGRILAALSGQRTNIQLKTDFVVTRLLANGRVDTTFGLDGFATVDTQRIDTVRAVAVDSRNRVLVMGATDTDPLVTGYDALVVRLTASGSIDRQYGSEGRVYPSYGSSTGQLVLAGHTDAKDRLTVALGTDGGDYGVVRVTDTGRRDKSFGTGGKAGGFCSCGILAATWSSGVVFALSSIDPLQFQTAKFTASGAIATAWGGDGVADAPLPTGVSVNGSSLAAGPNGSVVVGGMGAQDDGLGNFTDAVLIGRLDGS